MFELRHRRVFLVHLVPIYKTVIWLTNLSKLTNMLYVIYNDGLQQYFSFNYIPVFRMNAFSKFEFWFELDIKLESWVENIFNEFYFLYRAIYAPTESR